MTPRHEISEHDDVINVCDVTARIEYLRDDDLLTSDEVAEMAALECLIDEMRGYGGDYQWEGDWYPAELIRESHFITYARELAGECGGYDTSKIEWPYTCIDWKEAAKELRDDYTPVEFQGVTFWYR